MKALLKPLLKTKCFDRSFEENLVCLRYPNPDAREAEFAFFFDSPFCAAFQHKEFKGVFIIDVSNYTSVVDKPINDLEQYIKENASDEFCFICLFDSSLKKDIEKGVKSKDCDTFSFVDLELDNNAFMEFSKKVEQSTYERLKKTFKVTYEHGHEFECLVLFTFDEDNKHYVLYTPLDSLDSDKAVIFASYYEPNPEQIIMDLTPIESKSEWQLITDKINDIRMEILNIKTDD